MKRQCIFRIYCMGVSEEDVKKGTELRTEIERCKKELENLK